MIFTPASEVPDLIAALHERIDALTEAIRGETHPERLADLQARLTRARDLRTRYEAIQGVWDGSDAAWCGLIHDVAEAAEEATATPAGRNEVFTSVRIRMTEELTP